MTIINILAVLISPALAVYIGQWLNRRNEVRSQRFNVLYTMMTTRVNRANIHYVNALNSIDIVFSDEDKVRVAWKDLKSLYLQNDPSAQEVKDKNMRLIEEIANSLGYKDKVTWQDISVPYTPVWLDREWESNTKFRDAQELLGEQLPELLKRMPSSKNR